MIANGVTFISDPKSIILLSLLHGPDVIFISRIFPVLRQLKLMTLTLLQFPLTTKPQKVLMHLLKQDQSPKLRLKLIWKYTKLWELLLVFHSVKNQNLILLF